VQRVFYHVTRGLIGIANNENFSITKKIILYTDYFKLIALAIQATISPQLTNYSIDKKFRINSFGLTVYYPNIYAFFFLFNEIFCNSEYPALFNMKTYIDLGANIGISLLWYHLFNPNMTAYAFEPDEINYRFLKKNIKENCIENCFLFKKAISNNINKVKFYRILDNIQNLDSGLKLNQKLPHEVFQVKTAKLSTLIKKIKHISLVKMDIEGGEYLVFDDLKKTNTLIKIERIIFESHVFTAMEKRSLAKILSWIGHLGKTHSHATSKYTSSHYWQNNELF